MENNKTMKYKIEHKIATLSDNGIMDNDQNPASFSQDEILFSHWEFDYQKGWLQDSWIAEATIEAANYKDAFQIIGEKLKRIVPRISLINQSYTEYLAQPFLITKEGSNLAFFRYTTDVKPVGLMFAENDREALGLLLKNEEIPEWFYYYWNDAVNAAGYSAKLLLMFSAIESITKGSNGKKDFKKVEEILGKELTADLFGTKENSETGLRHRLIHGEYFSGDDGKKDYMDLVHKKVIGYFNKLILKKDLLHEDVVNPQRHPFGNKRGGAYFIEPSAQGVKLNLKEVIADFSNGIRNLKNYKYVHDKGLTDIF